MLLQDAFRIIDVDQYRRSPVSGRRTPDTKKTADRSQPFSDAANPVQCACTPGPKKR
jgi:hypothetical protein